MALFDNLQKASFRGVAFGVKSVETQVGRRNAIHEYPNRNNPFSEDLGRKARVYNFDAFVVGDNYETARAALLAALEDSSEPGTLVHPALGSKLCVPTSCSHNLTAGDVEVEYFSLSFTEAGVSDVLTTQPNTFSFATTKAQSLFGSASNFFIHNFRVTHLADFIASSAVTKFMAFSGYAAKIASNSGANASKYAKYTSLLASFNQNLASNIYKPELLASSVNDIASSLGDMFDSKAKALRFLILLFDFAINNGALSSSTSLRDIEKSNSKYIVLLIKTMALAQMFALLASMDFASNQDAIAKRDLVAKRAQDLLLLLADEFNDEIYTSTQDSLVASVQAINTRAQSLGSVQYITINTAIPAIVLAYEQYGDAGKYADILALNSNIVNPLFVPASTQIAIIR